MDSPYNFQTNSGHFKEVRYDAYNRSSADGYISEKGGIPLKKLVCDVFKADKDAIFSNGRRREQATIRQVYMYLMQKYTAYSSKTIGEMARGTRNKPFHHATVMHANKMVNDLYDTDKIFREKIDMLKEIMNEKLINFDK
jgi:hypothetical protein